MPFSRPSRQALIDRSAGDVQSRVAGADAQLRRNVFAVFAAMFGAGFDGLYGYLDFIAKQAFPWSLEDEFADRYAGWWGVSRKLPSAATGSASVSGAGTIPALTIVQRSDGFQYATVADVTIAGAGTVQLQALTPGSTGNAATGTSLAFLQPVDGVNSALTVLDPGIAGEDAEKTDVLLARVEEIIQAAPQGGDAEDYVEWAEEQPGVTRGFTLPQWQGPGTVGLAIVDDTLTPPIPSDATVAAVQAAVDVLRPVRATLFVIKPTAHPLDLTISLTPSNDDTKAAATAALQDLIAREAVVAGAIDPDSLETLDGGIYLSHIRDAVQTATGVIDSDVTSPATARIVPAAGEILILGTITWA